MIGIVENITRQKTAEEALVKARSRDSLTGLYNRDSGIRLVQECMADRAPGEHGVLMLLDMDGFEDVNLKEGRILGTWYSRKLLISCGRKLDRTVSRSGLAGTNSCFM